MPALRSRLEDLPLLIRDFAAHNVAEGRAEVQLAPRTLAGTRAVPVAGQRARACESGRTSFHRHRGPHRRHRRFAREIPALRLDRTQWVAPQFASEIASLDTTVAERILLDGDDAAGRHATSRRRRRCSSSSRRTKSSRTSRARPRIVARRSAGRRHRPARAPHRDRAQARDAGARAFAGCRCSRCAPPRPASHDARREAAQARPR